jgi:GAF domain-containing protein
MSRSSLTEALDALSRFLVADASIGDTLQRVADIAVEAVPAAAMAGITMLDGDERATTAVFTDAGAPEIDQAQYDSGRGPCLDAWRHRTVVRLDDVDDERAAPYPEFADACREHGIFSTLSLPLVNGDRGMGALNLYAPDRRSFTADDEAVGGDLATAASVVVANSVAYWGAYDLSQQMTEAMQSRAVIEQAKGMLMAQSPMLQAEDAFDLLRRASQRENVKLREIAQRIVERRPLSGPPG